MPSTISILKAVRDSGDTFEGFFRRLPYKPGRLDGNGWSELKDSIGAVEALELVTIRRNKNDDITFIRLTDLGTERLKEAEKQELEDEQRKQRRHRG